MIVIQIHQYKHRVTNSGILQSSPVGEDDWKERGADEMNLPLIAKNELRNTIISFSERYPENFVARRKQAAEQPKFTAHEAI